MTTDLPIARLERARALGVELHELLGRLATTFSGSDVVLFLDRLARCAAYSTEEQQAAELTKLVADSRNVLAHAPALIAEAAASGLNLDSLARRVEALLDDDSTDDADDVALDLLMVATVIDHLQGEAQQQARRVLDRAQAALVALPERFESAAELGRDRARLEAVAAQPKPTRELVLALVQAAEDADAVAVADSLGRRTSPQLIAKVLDQHVEVEPIQPAKRRPAAPQLLQMWQVVAAMKPGLAMAADSQRPYQLVLNKLSPGLFFVRDQGKAWLEWVDQKDEPRPELWRTKPTTERLSPETVKDGIRWAVGAELAEAGLELRWPSGLVEPLEVDEE